MKFTKENTLELKGIMVLLLVFHHCFYGISTLGPTIEIGNIEYNLIQSMAMAARICVMAFIVVSGYGLYKTVGTDKCKLYTKSFVKLYLNYFFVVVLTLLITLFFRSDFPEIYCEDSIFKILYRITTSLTGVQYLFASGGINMTWWFASFLIICYCLYPFLLKGVDKYPLQLLFISLLFVPFRDVTVFHIGVFGILSYISSFILGMVLARYEILEKICYSSKRIGNYILVILCIIAKLLLYRIEVVTYYIDLLLIVLIMIILMKKKIKLRICQWFGKISMDIYYFHYLFIFYIALFSNFIYSKQNFIIIYLKAMAISIMMHYIVVFIRKILRIDVLIEKIENCIERKYKEIRRNETV